MNAINIIPDERNNYLSLPAGLVDLFSDPRAVGINTDIVLELKDLYSERYATASVELWLSAFKVITKRLEATMLICPECNSDNTFYWNRKMKCLDCGFAFDRKRKEQPTTHELQQRIIELERKLEIATEALEDLARTVAQPILHDAIIGTLDRLEDK